MYVRMYVFFAYMYTFSKFHDNFKLYILYKQSIKRNEITVNALLL